ncbi:MAG: hypothetical protein AAF597_10995, partial [Bacteroidota bacterium]
LSPSTPGKARAQKALYDLRENRPDFEAAERACEDLHQRHEDWLDLYLVATELRLLEALDSVLVDRKTVLNRQSASLDFDWNELLDLRKEQTELQLRKLELTERNNHLLAAYNLGGASLDFSDFPAISDLQLDAPTLLAAQDPEIAYKLELASREIALERAEGRQYLDFVQAQYRGPHEDLFAERLSVGVGFQLPGSGNRQLKIRELELEQQELLYEQEIARAADQLQAQNRVAVLRGLVRVYTTTQALLDEEAAELDQLSSNLQRREGFDPLPILDILARKLKNQLRTLDQQQEILERFLELQEVAICADQDRLIWVQQ